MRFLFGNRKNRAVANFLRFPKWESQEFLMNERLAIAEMGIARIMDYYISSDSRCVWESQELCINHILAMPDMFGNRKNEINPSEKPIYQF